MRSIRLTILLVASCALASCAQIGRLVDRVTPDRKTDDGEAVATAEADGSATTPPKASSSGRKGGGRTGSSRGTKGNEGTPGDGAAGLDGLPATDAAADSAAAATLPSPDPEIVRIYAEGLAAQKSGRYDVALDNWERVWAADPEFEDVADLLLKEHLVRGLESFATGSLDEAITSWERARRIRPESPRVQAYLARALEQRARTAPVN